jgi:hypothetical protein
MLREEDFEPGVGPWRMSIGEYNGDVLLIQDTADGGFQVLQNFKDMAEAEKALKMLNKKWEVKR